MKRPQRWSLASEEGPVHRMSPTGPFRRRRALRHLDSLAQHPAGERSPNAAVAHVRVIGHLDGSLPEGERNESPAPLRPVLGGEIAATLGSAGEESRFDGDRLHAVPIDEPLGVSARPVAQQG